MICPYLMVVFLQPWDGYFEQGVVRFYWVLYVIFHRTALCICSCHSEFRRHIQDSSANSFSKIAKPGRTIQLFGFVGASAWFGLKNSSILFHETLCLEMNPRIAAGQRNT